MMGLDQFPLWKRFCQIATDEQRSMLRKFCDKASNRLLLVRDTFPTYTIHNETHSLNIIDIMGNLIGDRIEDLNPLEIALLILSAYYHDTGMVFTDEERKNINNEVDFDIFLQKFPRAHLLLKESQLVNHQIIHAPDEITEWFCRWIHPDRSATYLKSIEPMRWKNFPINSNVATLCKSHGYDIKQVASWDETQTDLLGSADMLFCSIILRLADILDFDNTRSPDEVYKYLGLANKRTIRETVSDVEWQKHLCSNGFIFPKANRNERYSINFAASPFLPAVEYDVREFLKVIEFEFEKCNAALKFCSSRWQNFKLPNNIDKKDIKSQGYYYGEFRFTLMQDKIIDLLMGENLYTDSYAFIRELAQNAIDTSRHRIEYEKGNGNLNFEIRPIEFSEWRDKDGYSWVRIDDYGMGMDEEIILNYLLKVGKSYYQSEEFKLQQITWRSKLNSYFTPISRFGIGILSCFIIGDRLEIVTRKSSVVPSKNGLRMTIDGLNSFFVLNKESDEHKCSIFPNKENKVELYRNPNQAGTSIAVRFNSKHQRFDFNLKNILSKYILDSVIPILCEGMRIGENYNRKIRTEWPVPKESAISRGLQDRIEKIFGIHLSGQIDLKIQALNLTKHSPTKNLEGQAIIAYIDIPEKDRHFFENEKIQRSLTISRIGMDTFNLDLKVRQTALIRQMLLDKEFNYDIVENHERIKRSIKAVYERGLLNLGSRLNNLLHDRELEPAFTSFMEEYLFDNQVSNKERKLFSDPQSNSDIRELYFDICLLNQQLANKEKKIIVNEKINLLQYTDDLNYLIQFRGVINKISHNGIRLPLTTNNNYQFDIESPIKNGLFVCSIALKDELMPDLSLSRESIKKIDWNIYSVITLTIARAVKDFYHKKITFDLDVFKDVMGNEFELQEILKDSYIGIDKEWATVKIFETSNGLFTLQELRQHLKEAGYLNFKNPLDLRKWEPQLRLSFLQYCLSSLIQIGLCVKYNCKKEMIVVYNTDVPVLEDGLKAYPPLYFIEYEDSDLLRYNNTSVNIKHPFSFWLLKNTQRLKERFPGLLAQIRSELSRTVMYLDDISLIIKSINKVLGRLNELNFIDQPLELLLLKKEDFSVTIGSTRLRDFKNFEDFME